MKFFSSTTAAIAIVTTMLAALISNNPASAVDFEVAKKVSSKDPKQRQRRRQLKGPDNFAEQVFYSDEATKLEMNLYAQDDQDDIDHIDYMIDLGVLRGSDKKNAKENTALIDATFTTSIFFSFDFDDDDTDTEFEAHVYLTMLAYSGCDSAASCEAANIEPTPLIPERVEMVGWNRYIELEGIDYNDDFVWEDQVISTNESKFVLAGKGSGDIFLKAMITVDGYVYAYDYEHNGLDIVVKNWVMVVSDGDDLSITESNGYEVDLP